MASIPECTTWQARHSCYLGKTYFIFLATLDTDPSQEYLELENTGPNHSVGQGFQLFDLHLYLLIFYKFACQNIDSTEVIVGIFFHGRNMLIEAL